MRNIIFIVTVTAAWIGWCDTPFVARTRYLDLMECAVNAYSPAHMTNYLARVRGKGLAEHGFPRLCANLAILLAHGRVPARADLFLHMMDECCHQIPTAHARNGFGVGNDFSVKEICLAIRELERAQRFPAARIAAWRADISRAVAQTTYSANPKPGSPTSNNWAVFGAASEQARLFTGMGGDAAWVERHLADQMRFFDANGMYQDPHQPMVYDFVTRLQYAVALSCGYTGPSRARLEALLLRSAEPTLRLQSVTGEIPFGGRSNQFLHNETFYAALCEYYAAWFNRRDETATAIRFRRAARRAVDSLDYWLKRPTIRHVKNRYPLETKYGTENYGYFDKYMVTMGSWAALAYLFADETIPEGPIVESDAPSVWSTTPAFHQTILSAGGYTAQFDTHANPQYDCSGLGRLQKRGAPPFICLSVPFPRTPNYRLDVTNATPLAILPGWRANGTWRFPVDPKLKIREQFVTKDSARVVLELPRPRAQRPPLVWTCTLDAQGLRMELTGDDELAFALPAFETDGERTSGLTRDAEGHGFSVTFDGATFRAEGNGTVVDTHRIYGNRNGHYRRLELRGGRKLEVRLSIRRTANAPISKETATRPRTCQEPSFARRASQILR